MIRTFIMLFSAALAAALIVALILSGAYHPALMSSFTVIGMVAVAFLALLLAAVLFVTAPIEDDRSGNYW